MALNFVVVLIFSLLSFQGSTLVSIARFVNPCLLTLWSQKCAPNPFKKHNQEGGGGPIDARGCLRKQDELCEDASCGEAADRVVSHHASPKELTFIPLFFH